MSTIITLRCHATLRTDDQRKLIREGIVNIMRSDPKGLGCFSLTFTDEEKGRPTEYVVVPDHDGDPMYRQIPIGL